MQVGSSDDVTIYYSIFAAAEDSLLHHRKVVKQGVLSLSNAIKTFDLDYDEKMGEGLTLTFAWVKNGRFHCHEARIRRPMPVKRLNVT